MSLVYHQLTARSGRTRSVVVLLHGFGSNGAAMLGLAQTLSIALPDTAFLAPDAPDLAPGQSGGHMWFPILELDGSGATEVDARLVTSARRIDAFLDDQLSIAGLAASSMALFGFSQGASLAYEVAPRRIDQLAGVIAVAGRMRRMAPLAAEVRSKPPFLILNGANDHLITTEESSRTAAIMSQSDIPTIRNTMSGIGHGISDDGINTAGEFLKGVINQKSQT